MGRTVALGDGVQVPYPEPSSAGASRIGKGNRRVGTTPEVRLRSVLHGRGLRFRKDHLLRIGSIRVKPDVVFPTERMAIFVDGCFWHCCPEHGIVPKANIGYWEPKLQRNTARDQLVNEALDTAGWLPLRIWEHVPAHDAADLVAATHEERRAERGRVTRPSYVSCHAHPDAVP